MKKLSTFLKYLRWEGGQFKYCYKYCVTHSKRQFVEFLGQIHFSNKVISFNGRLIEEEQEVAEAFNDYFIEKIDLLKKGIDQTLTTDPLEKLANKMKNNKHRFNLKRVSQNKLTKTMKKLKKKKSAGIDGLCQDQLIMGANVLVGPLSSIIKYIHTFEAKHFDNFKVSD